MTELIPWIVALLPVCLSVAVAFLLLTDVRAGAIIEAMRRLPTSHDGSDHTGEAGGNARRERSAA